MALPNNVPAIITFSGIDGAGKSTQITALQKWLAEARIPFRTLTFWDDIVVLSQFRESLSRRAFGGDQGVGTPEQPVNRRDKNISSWPVILFRYLLYFADAVSLRVHVHALQSQEHAILIFDRYIYDELANLPQENGLTRMFLRLILAIAPRADIAYLIDADPNEARARKPEYPVEFLHQNRANYLALSREVEAMEIIEPDSPEAAAANVRERFLARARLAKSIRLPKLALP